MKEWKQLQRKYGVRHSKKDGQRSRKKRKERKRDRWKDRKERKGDSWKDREEKGKGIVGKAEKRDKQKLQNTVEKL